MKLLVRMANGDDDVYNSTEYDERVSTGGRPQFSVQHEYVVGEDQTLRVIEKRMSPERTASCRLMRAAR